LKTVGQERLGDLRSALKTAERQGGEAQAPEHVTGSPHGPELSGKGLRSRPTYSEARGEEAKGLEHVAGSPHGPEPSGKGLRSRPTHSEVQGEEAKEPEGWGGSPYGLTPLDDGSPSAPPYGEPAEIELDLTELSQQGEWGPLGVTPQASSTGEPQPFEEMGADLNDLSERSFRAGLSSGQKSS
jgi:hypothetical protein